MGGFGSLFISGESSTDRARPPIVLIGPMAPGIGMGCKAGTGSNFAAFAKLRAYLEKTCPANYAQMYSPNAPMLSSKFAKARTSRQDSAPVARPHPSRSHRALPHRPLFHRNRRPRFLVAPQDRPVHRHPASPSHARSLRLHHRFSPSRVPRRSLHPPLQPHACSTCAKRPSGAGQAVGIPSERSWSGVALSGQVGVTHDVAVALAGSATAF